MKARLSLGAGSRNGERAGSIDDWPSEDSVWSAVSSCGGVCNSEHGTDWKRSVRQQDRSSVAVLVKKLLGAGLGHRRRGQRQIKREYERQWAKKRFQDYARVRAGGAPWIWGDRRFFLSNEGGAKVRFLYLAHAVEKLRPRRVLEVGSGNGLNLLLLSCCFPDTEFTGLEFTESGVRQLAGEIERGQLRPELAAFSPRPVATTAGVSTIRVLRGSGAALPFASFSFDLVFTVLALEQMEAIRERAISELARVSSDRVLMLEPFREWNSKGVTRRYVKAYDYFQGGLDDLDKVGLDVESVSSELPSKAWLRTVLVVARRRRAS